MSRNMLTMEKTIQLGHYLEGRRKALLADRPAHRTVAKVAAQELGFGVTEANIRAALKALDIKYRCKVDGKVRKTGKTRIHTRDAAVLQIREALNAALDLWVDFGPEVEAQLSEIMDAKRR